MQSAAASLAWVMQPPTELDLAWQAIQEGLLSPESSHAPLRHALTPLGVIENWTIYERNVIELGMLVITQLRITSPTEPYEMHKLLRNGRYTDNSTNRSRVSW